MRLWMLDRLKENLPTEQYCERDRNMVEEMKEEVKKSIVKDIKEGFKRVKEYVFPMENERAMKAYGMGSGINKELVINKEVTPGRITMIIVKEKLGF